MPPPSFDLAKCPTVDTIRLLASLLERMTAANDQLNKAAAAAAAAAAVVRRASSASPLGTSPVTSHSSTSIASCPSPAPITNYTRFHARSIPSIDIFSYLTRILKYCPCDNECFLSLLVYFDRMSKNSLALTGQPFTIDSYNIHRLIIAGVMVASKYFSDVFYTNTRYAKVGGLPVSELNSLELEFLALNNFNMTIPVSELQRYGDRLLKVEFMGQEVIKAIMYETPSTPYSPVIVRHVRSTSLGTSSLASSGSMGRTPTPEEQAHHHHPLYPQQQVKSMDWLCDMTSRVSLYDDYTRRSTGDSSISTPPSTTPWSHSNGSSGSLNSGQWHYPQTTYPSLQAYPSGPPRAPSSTGSMRRMSSYGSLQLSPGQYVFKSPVSIQEVDDHPTTQGTSLAQSYVDPQQRQSHDDQQPPPLPHHYTRQRHGSMGMHYADNSHTGRGGAPQRTPRHSRSSINLTQGARASSSSSSSSSSSAGNGAVATAPGTAGKHVPNPRRLSFTAPPFVPHYQQESMGASTLVYYHPPLYPLGIPTPPPSSSPVHQKQATPPSYPPMYL